MPELLTPAQLMVFRVERIVDALDDVNLCAYPLQTMEDIEEAIGRDDTVYLDDLWVAERGEGRGRQLMREVCAAADDLGVALFLVAAAPYRYEYPRLGQQDLVAWYERLGFVHCFGYMKREPAPSAVTLARELLNHHAAAVARSIYDS